MINAFPGIHITFFPVRSSPASHGIGRCHADEAPKNLGEVVAGTEAQPLADVPDALVRSHQFDPRIFDPLLLDIILQTDAHFIIEFLRKVVIGIPTDMVLDFNQTEADWNICSIDRLIHRGTYPKVMILSTPTDDLLYEHTRGLHRSFEKAGVTHVYRESDFGELYGAEHALKKRLDRTVDTE